MSPESQIVIEIIIMVMCLASALTYSVVRCFAPSSFEDLRLRIRTWWFMIAVFLTAMLLGPVVSLLFFAVLSFLSLREYLSLIPVRQADRPVLLCLYATIPVQYSLIASHNYEMFVIFVPVVAFLLVSTVMVVIGESAGFIRAVGTLNWGLMLTVYMLGHVGFLLVLSADGDLGLSSAGAVLFLVLLTEANDVAQYITGKLFGRSGSLVKVSPHKTAEGLAGGLLATAALAIVVSPRLVHLTPLESVAAGVLIALAGFLGDITMSAVKRDLGIKDSGRLLPGHGGILDRVDSLLFTAPVFFHYIYQLRLYRA